MFRCSWSKYEFVREYSVPHAHAAGSPKATRPAAQHQRSVAPNEQGPFVSCPALLAVNPVSMLCDPSMRPFTPLLVIILASIFHSATASLSTRCPVGAELKIRFFNTSTPPSWQIFASVNSSDGPFLWSFPAFFHGKPSSTVPELLRAAKLQNVTAEGLAMDCFYDVMLGDQGLYMTNMAECVLSCNTRRVCL